MRFETITSIDAAVDRIWAILVDVERWPEMSPSFTSVERLDAGPFGKGSQARLQQPRLRPATWTVTEFEPDHSFVWESRAPGIVTTGGHYLTTDSGTVSVRLDLDQQGPTAPIVGHFYGRLIRRYLDQEAAGLKRLAEST